MYGIHTAGADGSLATLIGSRASDSGGNSMAPAGLIDLSVRPTKVDRASDVTGLVDTGQLASLLSLDDTVAVMEAIQRISDRKLQAIDPKQPWADPKQTTVTRNEVVRELVSCGYVKAADVVDRFGDPSSLNPDLDPDIVGAGGIFSQAEYDNDDEFRKTAAVMKMVLSGYAGAGTITLGGYDYHGQGRATGELRDLRAGRCMGACLEYAARRGLPLMLYVFSDGSISGERPGRRHGRRPRQVHVDQRQPVHRRLVLPGLQPRAVARAGQYRRGRHGTAPADRLFPFGCVGRDCFESGGGQRQPAGRDGRAQLHGPARRAGPVRDALPAQRARQFGAAGQPDRLQPDRERPDRHSGSFERTRIRVASGHCLRCPRCAGALEGDSTLSCAACGMRYPLVDGMPWLLPAPDLALAEWRGRLHALTIHLKRQAAQYRAALRPDVTRSSDAQPAQAAGDGVLRSRATPAVAAGAARDGGRAGSGSHVCGARSGRCLGAGTRELLRQRAPRLGLGRRREPGGGLQPSVGAGQRRVRRDCSVLGSGAGRLAYDLHASLHPALTVAADINPLLMAVARRMYAAERVDLYEFPVAPRDLASHALLRALTAPARAEPGLHLVFGDAKQPPFAPGSFDTVVTPWLVDVVDTDLDSLAATVNTLLAPGGRWVSTGTLFFQQADPAQAYSSEEVQEIVAGAGFESPQLQASRQPYLASPASRHARVEEVVTFAVRKQREAELPLRPVPPWLADPRHPVPLLPEVATTCWLSGCAVTWLRWSTAGARCAT